MQRHFAGWSQPLKDCVATLAQTGSSRRATPCATNQAPCPDRLKCGEMPLGGAGHLCAEAHEAVRAGQPAGASNGRIDDLRGCVGLHGGDPRLSRRLG